MDAFKPPIEPFHLRADICSTHGEFERKGFIMPMYGKQPGKVIWAGCPHCTREEAERDVAAKRTVAEHAQQKRIEERLHLAGIPKRFLRCTFQNYIADTHAKCHALEVASQFALNFKLHAEKGSTFVFAGNTGTGKGHLAAAAMKTLMAQGQSALFVSAKEIMLRLRARWDDRNAPSEMEVLRMLTTVSFLVIDEVGVQYNTDAERDQMFGVIDGRYRDMMPTILTTNLDRKSLQLAVGDRSFSRLREEGTWVPFDWEDYRSKKS